MNQAARLGDLVLTSSAVRAARGRLDKRACMAALFARLGPEDLGRAASWLAGEIPQGALHVGWSALQAAATRPPDDLPLFRAAAAAAPPAPSPTLAEVEAVFESLRRAAGPGAGRRRTALLADLVARSTPAERDFVFGLLLGELRQGALRALVLEALAQALAVPLPALRRAVMFAGSFADVVRAVARDGAAALAGFELRALVPIEPMLAAQAADLEAGLAGGVPAAVEWKLDGVRVQLHRDGDQVRVFSRQLRDVTALVPELCSLALQLPGRRFVLDGEVIALDAGGRPIAFQDLMSALGRDAEAQPERARAEAAARPRLVGIFFDVLLHDDEVLVDRPYRDRRARLERLVPAAHVVAQRVAASPAEAQPVFDAALAAGHEGVLVKSLDAPYTAGRRGAAWRKVKPAVTLDLVILAAEWGHGRRRGLLSNLHLGARVPGEPGRFLMLGKTFKGLTDAMLRQLTADLLGLATADTGGVVRVPPVRVVEIAFDALQRSPRYDSGLALRFARVKRFRPDKTADQATSIDEVRALASR